MITFGCRRVLGLDRTRSANKQANEQECKIKKQKEATRSVAGQFPGDDRSYRVWPALRFAKGIRLVCGCAKDVLGLHLVAMGSVWMLTISWDALHSGDEDTENVFERPFGNFHDPPLLSLLLHTLLYNIRYPNKEI